MRTIFKDDLGRGFGEDGDRVVFIHARNQPTIKDEASVVEAVRWAVMHLRVWGEYRDEWQDTARAVLDHYGPEMEAVAVLEGL